MEQESSGLGSVCAVYHGAVDCGSDSGVGAHQPLRKMSVFTAFGNMGLTVTVETDIFGGQWFGQIEKGQASPSWPFYWVLI